MKVLLKTRPHPKYIDVNDDRAKRMLKFARGVLMSKNVISEARLDQLGRYVEMVKRDIDHTASKNNLDTQSM